MRRSTGIALVAMASLSLAACDDTTYHSVDECVLNGHHSTDDCRSAYLQALERHNTEAPQYASLEECEANTEPMEGGSRCEAAVEPGFTVYAPDGSTSHGSSYRPRFSSFAYGSWSSSGAHPVYHDAHGSTISSHAGGGEGSGGHGVAGEGGHGSIGHAGSAHAASGHGGAS